MSDLREDITEAIDIVLEPEAVERPGPVEVDIEEKSLKEARIVTQDEGIADLKKSLERAKQAQQEAERRAFEEAAKAQAAQLELHDTNRHFVGTVLDGVIRDGEVLERQWQEAIRANDLPRASKIQSAMADNAVRKQQLEEGKKSMEAQAKLPVTPMAPISRGDPVEDFASQLSPASAEWIRAHPQCVTDQGLREEMLLTHSLALRKGYRADTPEYFAFVERAMELEDQPREQARVETPARRDEPVMSAAATSTHRRSPAPPSAPVSRSGTANGERAGVVRLTADEREVARMSGMTDQQYAINKVKLLKEQRMGTGR